MLKSTCLAFAVVLLSCTTQNAIAQSFSDGFEGAFLSPVWTVIGPGTAVLTNNYAHSGVQSLQTSTSSSYPYSVQLIHDFGLDVTGSVSVYLHNALPYGAATDLEIRLANGGWANIEAGVNFPGGNSFQSRVCSTPSDTAPLCTTGLFFNGSAPFWHKLEIDAGSSGVTVKLDNAIVVTDPSITTFRAVSLDTWSAPSAGSAYYDDFSATVTCQMYPSPCITNPQSGVSPQSQFVALSGGGTAGDKLSVLVNGVPVGSVTVDAEGNWDALPYIHIFGTPVVTIQVQDTATTDLSNTISVNNAIGPFVPPPPVPVSFLPLRHGDILISSNPSSLEVELWGATWTHSAVFLGGDANGTPQVAEAVITQHFNSACTNSPGLLQQCGITQVVTLEGSALWDKTTRIADFTPRNPLTAVQRDGIIAYARGKSGLPYWNYAETFDPLIGAYALWPVFAGTARFKAFLNQMNASKNLDTAFECATLVWRAYLEGTSHLVDISNPNNMTAQPWSIFSFLLGPGGSAFIDQIRPNWVLPETFATSPNLQQIF